MKEAVSEAVTFACAVGLLLALVGCVPGPAGWAKRLQTKVKCGMSLQEVEQLSGRTIAKLNRPWATHFTRDDIGGTEAWLVFDDDKLQSVQLAWVKAPQLMTLETAEKVNLCR